MSITAAKPATTPIPVQLSETEFTAFIFPHLSMPKRGPKCKLGYYRVFNLILWVLYTGMQWKCLPVPTDANGTPAIHYTTVYKVFAKWADDGSLWQAFIASVRHLAAEKQLDTSVLHGDGTNTVAKKGAMGLATRPSENEAVTSGKVAHTASYQPPTRALVLSRCQGQSLLHIQFEGAIGRHMRMNQRGQRPQVLWRHPRPPRLVRQDLLNHQGVDVHHRNLEQ